VDLDLNTLLTMQRIDPAKTLILRHRPFEASLDRVLPWLAAEKPEVFNAYQQSQGPVLERAMLGAKHLVSCIRNAPGRALLVGIYAIGTARSITVEEFWQMPEHKQAANFGYQGFKADAQRPTTLFFDLQLQDSLAQWKGKLVLEWRGGERSWWRWANRNVLRVHAILEESALAAAPPPWDEMRFSWNELQVLPQRWRNALEHWRGIYFILDESDGRGYVGSAYSNTNILGRWLGYAATGHGGNVQLRNRDPQRFRFSILERVSPDMPADEVIRREASWKLRLHTREYGLNSN